jgi:DNA-binding LytR/AlgR family response regulator
MIFKAIIVEDLPEASDMLANFCRRSGAVNVAGRFPDAVQALEFLQSNQVDLVFLDVEMPGITGFEFMRRLEQNPQVILTTSKTEYAYEAFQMHVADYLRKPFTYTRFLESLQLLSVKGQEQSAEPESHLFIKVDGRLVRLSHEEILFVESAGDYVRFVTRERRYLTHNTIKNIESRLPTPGFMKVHRSYIVNLSHVLDFQEGMLNVGDASIPVSKAHKSKLRQQIQTI